MNELKVGQKYIGTLKNEYKDKVIELTEEMIDIDEDTLFFLHYYGFKLVEF